jgi:hypothetical protein
MGRGSSHSTPKFGQLTQAESAPPFSLTFALGGGMARSGIQNGFSGNQALNETKARDGD